MKFAFLLSYRELRAAWKRLVFYVICLSLGVAAIVAIRSTIQSVNVYTNREARTINGGDVLIRAGRELDDDLSAKVSEIAGGAVTAESRTTVTATMLRPVSSGVETAKMVEVKGVDSKYPLYGTLTLVGGEPYSYEMLARGGILINPTLASQLELGVGSRVRLGSGDFEVRGLIENEPGSGIGAFSFGPRVIIGLDELGHAGLGTGSIRTRNSILLRVEEGDYRRVVTNLKRELRSRLVLVRGYKDAEAGMNDQLSRASDYLSLVGLAILVLGGVGIWSVTRVYVRQRWKSIAVLKCLGCTTRRAVFAYTLQMLAIGVAGGLVGVALAWGSLRYLAYYLSGGPLAVVDVGVTWQALVQGLGVGLLVALLFSLIPLLGIRDIRPAAVLRSADPMHARTWSLARFLAGFVVGSGLLLITAWQAGSWVVGGFFLGGLVVTGVVCVATAELLIFVVRRMRSIPVFTLRQAIQGLQRPGNQTRSILVAVGLGVFFLVSTADVERTLLDLLQSRLSADLPDVFFVDVQADQVEDLRTIVTRYGGEPPEVIPTVRARLKEINGDPIQLDRVEESERRSQLGREYTLTTRSNLDENETIVEGPWWDEQPGLTAQVSVEDGLQRDLGLRIGDTLTFDIQGQEVVAEIANFRRVDWENSRTGFMFVVRPGGLDAVSMVFVGAAKAPADATTRGRMAREISDAHSNISVIDVRDIIATVGRVLTSIATAISVVGLIVLLAGGLILVGAISMARYMREFETALLKTLGATSRVVIGLVVAEYALLGALSGLVGSFMGIGLSRQLVVYVFELTWQFEPSIVVYGILGPAVLTTLVGIVSSTDLLLLKPLHVLKREEMV